jgi:translation initiation factor IF-1
MDDTIEIKDARVIEALPAALFKVETLTDKKIYISYLGGRMKVNKIRVLVGDRVSLEMDEYGGKPRIIKRL